MRCDKREGEGIQEKPTLVYGLLRGSAYSPDDPRGMYVQANLLGLLHIRIGFRLNTLGRLRNYSTIYTIVQRANDILFESQHNIGMSFWRCLRIAWDRR